MKIFNMFDKDGSGAIDAEELGEALRAMGHNLSHAEVSVYVYVRVRRARVSCLCPDAQGALFRASPCAACVSNTSLSVFASYPTRCSR